MKALRIFIVMAVGIVIGVGLIGCASKPKSFIITYDQSATWRAVDIRQDFKENNDLIWEILVDTTSKKYDLETINKESGYLRTAWKYTYVVNKQISNRYRSRIVVKVNQNFTQLTVKCESNWMDDEGWMQGYDTILLEDIYSDIQGKLGRVITR